jgi:hypothetical protein
MSKLGDSPLSSIPSGKNFFGAHAKAKPKNGFAIPWTPNLHILHSSFFSKGLPKQNFENKINFCEKPIEL